MTVTKLVRLDDDYNREMYISHIDKLNLYNGLRVYGIIFSEYILRTVDDTLEIERIEIHYQNQ